MGGQPKLDDTAAHGGQRSISITCASDQERGAWRQIVPFRGPGFVAFSAWYKTSWEGPGSRAGMPAPREERGPVVRFLFFRDVQKWDHPSIPWFAAPPSTKWAQFTKVLPASDEITSIGIELFNLSAQGTIWWDDIVLRKATDAEAQAAMREKYAQIDRAPQPGETGRAPEDGTTAALNPPVFVWLPFEGTKAYTLQWSADPKLPDGATETVMCQRMIYAPRHVFRPGKWYWRFGFEAPGPVGMVWSRTRTFQVSADAPQVPFPDVKAVVQKLTGRRPRDFVPPGGLDTYRQLAQGELKKPVEAMRRDAERYIGQELLPEPPKLPPPGDPNRGVEYTRIFRATRPFNGGMVACAQVYLLTGEERFGQEARRRLMHLMSWDPNGSTSLFHHDEPGTELVRVCPRVYDWIYPLLTDEDKAR
jgi:hypothetical protein